jgi:hypothetical protein
MDISTIVGLFNIIVGLMLVAALLLMGGGLMLWYVRLGVHPSYRDDAIDLMQWSVAILFVLVVLLWVAQWVQTHKALSMMIIVAAVAALVVYFVATQVLAGSGAEEDEHH